jgi:hypothetical protein
LTRTGTRCSCLSVRTDSISTSPTLTVKVWATLSTTYLLVLSMQYIILRIKITLLKTKFIRDQCNQKRRLKARGVMTSSLVEDQSQTTIELSSRSPQYSDLCLDVPHLTRPVAAISYLVKIWKQLLH